MSVRGLIYHTTSRSTPSECVRASLLPALPVPAQGQIAARFLFSPINPADINVIQGSYPSLPRLRPPSELGTPTPGYVAGNEGLAQITAVPSPSPSPSPSLSALAVGDWVVMRSPQLGTWRSAAILQTEDVMAVPRTLTALQAATVSINPASAWNMLHDFVALQSGDTVIQNGANSAVGQAVIQIANSMGVETVNLIRDSADSAQKLRMLQDLGGTYNATYSDLEHPERIKAFLNGSKIKLALNCVGGPTAVTMAKHLAVGGTMVTYGNMSRLSTNMSASQLIFRDIKYVGFWQSRWNQRSFEEQRKAMMDSLVDLYARGILKEPQNLRIIKIRENDDLESSTRAVQAALKAMWDGKAEGKYVIQWCGDNSSKL